MSQRGSVYSTGIRCMQGVNLTALLTPNRLGWMQPWAAPRVGEVPTAGMPWPGVAGARYRAQKYKQLAEAQLEDPALPAGLEALHVGFAQHG